MTYYNYHAVATNLIKTGHCKKAINIQKWNNISPALVLYFDNHKPMPIRQEKWLTYNSLLLENNIIITNRKF